SPRSRDALYARAYGQGISEVSEETQNGEQEGGQLGCNSGGAKGVSDGHCRSELARARSDRCSQATAEAAHRLQRGLRAARRVRAAQTGCSNLPAVCPLAHDATRITYKFKRDQWDGCGILAFLSMNQRSLGQQGARNPKCRRRSSRGLRVRTEPI